MKIKKVLCGAVAFAMIALAVTATTTMVVPNHSVVAITEAATTLSVSSLSVSNSSSGVSLSWSTTGSPTSFKVYRSTSKSGTYSLLATQTGRTYTDTTATSGKTYYYKVVACNSSATATSSIQSITYLTCPTPSLTNVSGGVKVSWSKSTGASKYYVYRKGISSSSYTKIGTTTSSSYTDSTAVDGTYYTYKVVAVSNGGAESGTIAKSIGFYAVPSISSLTAGSGKVTVKLSTTTAYYYHVQYSTSSSFSSYKSVTLTRTSPSTTITGLTSGTTYYFRVRAYGTISGNTYISAWSSTKSKTVS